ncbi:MAG: hypothetical protein JO051_05190, partial [Acidobacteriaceae bacterium]|nr:hypothetical protein [Acidobacteriaceae bacterium]
MKWYVRVLLMGCVVWFASTAGARSNRDDSLLAQVAHRMPLVVSTVPTGIGDLNPYGVAFVPRGFPENGKTQAGDILVANFNNSSNTQGTGTTIVSIGPDGMQNLFFDGPSGLGLTTALGVLRRGIVLVGNLPTTVDSTGHTIIEQGSLLAIDRSGKLIATFTDNTLLDGPWDLTLIDHGETAIVFVSSVLNGTVSRLVFHLSEDGEHITLERGTLVAQGYGFRTDPAALVVGPTGLAFDFENGLLFVASTDDNAIYAIPNALTRSNAVKKGQLVYKDARHLRGPLGLVLERDGNLITTNGDAVNPNANQPSELVEFT